MECLSSFDENSIPENWNLHGGLKVPDGLPLKIDDTVRVNNSLLLFHGSSVRLIEINMPEHMTKPWPSGIR